MADGEDPLNEEEKSKITKRTTFDQLTKAFHAPDEYAQYKANLEMQAQAQAGADPVLLDSARQGSAMSSIKSVPSLTKDKKERVGSQASHAIIDADIPSYTPLTPQQWLDRCQEFSKYHQVKFARLFQLLFYFVQHKSRAEICLHDTGKLSWKKARQFLAASSAEKSTLFKAIGSYTPFGAKENEFQEYQKLHFIQSNLDHIQLTEVEGFSIALAKLYRWLSTTIDLRIDDVHYRRAEKHKLRALREGALAKEAERQQRRENRLAEEMEKWEQAREDELAALEAADDAAEKRDGDGAEGGAGKG